jgi:hypothetical protein
MIGPHTLPPVPLVWVTIHAKAKRRVVLVASFEFAALDIPSAPAGASGSNQPASQAVL